MPSMIMTTPPSASTPGEVGQITARGNWVTASMARVRAALVARQMQPLSRAEWDELRASLAPVRPPPSSRKFHPTGSIFCS